MDEQLSGRAFSRDLGNDFASVERVAPTPQANPLTTPPTVTITAPLGSAGTAATANTAATVTDTSTAVVTFADGGYVVFYHAAGTGGTDLYMRRYTGAGIAVGAETVVNAFTGGNQKNPTAALLDDGSYVVAWESDGQDGTYNIYSRHYTAEGVTSGGDTLVNTITTFTQAKASIAALAHGGYVIAWESTTTAAGNTIRVGYQRYTDADATVGSQTFVDSGLIGKRGAAAVAAMADGGFAIAFSVIDGVGANLYGSVYLARYSEAGVASTLEALAIGYSGTNNIYKAPSIATLADGSYVVVWAAKEPNGSYPNGTITGQWFNADGSFRNSLPLNIAGLSSTTSEPVAVAMADGGFVVTFEQTGGGTALGQRFSANGDITDFFFLPASTGTVAAALADGGLIVAGRSSTTVKIQHLDTFLTATEQVSASLKGKIALADADNSGGSYTVTLSLDGGKLVVTAGTTGVTVDASNPQHIVLTGTLAQIKALLGNGGDSALGFLADSDTPPAAVQLTVTIDDGTTQGSTFETIKITAVNDAPVLDLDSGHAGTGSAVDYNGDIVTLAPNATLADDNASYTGAVLTVTAVDGGQDEILSIVASGDLTRTGGSLYYQSVLIGTVAGGNGTPLKVTFNASASAAAVGDVMAHITYSNERGTPGSPDKSVTFTLVDGGGKANSGSDTGTATATVSFPAANAAPTVTIADLAATEQVALDLKTSIVIGDTDNHGGTYTVTLALDHASGVLSADPGASGASIDASDPAAIVITGTLAQIQALLGDSTARIDFFATSDTPPASMALTVTIDDGTDHTSATETIAITAVNDSPTIANLNGDTITFVEGSSPIRVDFTNGAGTLAAVADAEADFNGGTLTIRVTDNKVASEDQIALANGGTTTISLSGTTVSVGGVAIGTLTPGGIGLARVFTFNANATAAHISVLLQNIGYANTNTANPTTATRTIEYVLTDGDGGSVTATSHVEITAVNDPLTLGANTGATALEGGTHAITMAELGYADVDTAPGAIVYSLGTLPTHGALELNGNALGVGGTFTQADINTGHLVYRHDGSETISDSFGFSVTDGAGSQIAGRTFTLTVTPVPDPEARDDAATTAENQAVVIDILSNEIVPDGAPAPAVAKINGASGTVFTLASGAQVTINPNGTLSYDPHGAYDWLISTATAAATNASNVSAVDSFSYTLATGGTATVQVTVTGLASAGDRLVGTAGAETITGTSGSDYFDGLGGADYMVGGTGDDIFIVDNAGDVARELANQGRDIVYASVSYSLVGQFVEELRLTGTAISGTGTGYDNVLAGNAMNNILDGGEGNDTIDGGTGADRMIGGLGNDIFYVDNAGDVAVEGMNGGTDTVNASVNYSLLAQYVENLVLTGNAAINGAGNALNNALTGNSAANTLDGGAGDDIIDGGGGIDTMIGGLGNDTFYVDQIGDLAVEAGNGGTDTVYASIAYSLAGQYVENLILTGSNAINGTGNSLANTLTGNGAANTLDGGEGNDTIDGGGGADTMIGGAGDDVYYVGQAGDLVIEYNGQGNDTVNATVSYSLAGQFIENLTLAGTGAISGTGNKLANLITGNGAANTLDGGEGNDTIDGGGGADTMIGGLGDDIFYIDQIGDIAMERISEGNDLVYASITYSLSGQYIEGLTLTGSADIDGTGTKYDNVLTGNSGANQLHGGMGADTLTGGGGADGFWFDTYLGGTNVDTIADFVVGEDNIHLDGVIFTTLADGILDGNAFAYGAAAQDADDRILYDAVTGSLYYDEDGSGTALAVLFARVSAGTALTSANIVVHQPDIGPTSGFGSFAAFTVPIADLSAAVDRLLGDPSGAHSLAIEGSAGLQGMVAELDAYHGGQDVAAFASLQPQLTDITFIL